MPTEPIEHRLQQPARGKFEVLRLVEAADLGRSTRLRLPPVIQALCLQRRNIRNQYRPQQPPRRNNLGQRCIRTLVGVSSREPTGPELNTRRCQRSNSPLRIVASVRHRIDAAYGNGLQRQKQRCSRRFDTRTHFSPGKAVDAHREL